MTVNIGGTAFTDILDGHVHIAVAQDVAGIVNIVQLGNHAEQGEEGEGNERKSQHPPRLIHGFRYVAGPNLKKPFQLRTFFSVDFVVELEGEVVQVFGGVRLRIVGLCEGQVGGEVKINVCQRVGSGLRWV